MKKITRIKAMFIALMMLLGLIAPVTATAQKSDGFFRGGDDIYQNRSEGINDNTGSGIQNDDFGAPLGSGLLILTALGAGYAVAKRRRKTYRRGAALIFALILLLGMTNCKKKKTEPITPAGSNQVSITLNVDNGSRADVNPPHVNFVEGDRILVAYDGKYVGYIDHNGTCFTGTIDATGDNTKPLYFYFLGNKADVSSLTKGSSTTCTVNISDQTYQTENPTLPVISMAPSNETYPSDGNHYTARLHNKCSLMKFNVTTSSTAPICITGMNNKVTVDFSKTDETSTGLGEGATDNGFKYGKDDEGIIKMVGGSSAERWIIVLPQAALEETGEAFSEDNAYFGTRPALSAITTDQYLSSGVSMTVNTPAWDGDLSKLTASSSERYATANNGVTITGTLAADVKVSIADGATVTLNGANINNNNSKSGSSNFAGITCLGNATLNLEGGSIINCASAGYPGIQAGPSGNTLTIQGTGSLSAQGGSNAPGIGGGNEITCGNISLLGGQISACGGDNAPGLGCGQNGSCGNINISRNVEKINITGGSGASTSIGTSDGSSLTIDDVADPSYINTGSFVYHPVNLSTLTSNYIAKCGDVLRGTLTNNVTISIDDEAPATVILSGANIEYEGIVCVSSDVKFFLFGTNSAIANSNPGIQAPSSGVLTIDGSGSINVQSNAVGCAGIGGKINVNCGAINIKGGSITSCGGQYGAGIGSGQNANCADIEIEGGTISATGGAGAAGIGSGQGGSCGNIDIEGGTVTANGGDGANNIGAGQNGTCGNVTLPPLSGLFSVSETKQVRFSRGNLQYIGSAETPYWKFAENQRDYIGNSQGNSSTDIDRDLFGWGTSGYNGMNPYMTDGGFNSYCSGIDNIANTNYDWGVYNTISNATGQWRTLTIDEWDYLLENNTNGSSVVDGVAGWVIRPDGVTTGISSSYTEEEWATEEANGTVFLPAAGQRQNTSVTYAGTSGYYWSSSAQELNSKFAHCFINGSSDKSLRSCGYSVRLVQDANN